MHLTTLFEHEQQQHTRLINLYKFDKTHVSISLTKELLSGENVKGMGTKSALSHSHMRNRFRAKKDSQKAKTKTRSQIAPERRGTHVGKLRKWEVKVALYHSFELYFASEGR